MPVLLPWRGVALNDGPPILTSLTDAETDRLCDLAVDKTVLEIGSAYGYSAIAMVLAGARHVFAVDPHVLFDPPHPLSKTPTLETMRRNLATYGVADKVTMLVGYSQDVVPALRDSWARFGLIFVDGDHEYEAVSQDLALSLSVLEVGGRIAAHDYGEVGCVGVPPAWDEFVSQHGSDDLEEPVDTLVVWP